MKPQLRPPGSAQPQTAPETENYRWMWLSLAVVLVLGLLVIFILPAFVTEPPPGLAAPATPAALVADPQANNEAANQAMQAWLKLRAKLELENVARWGEPDWSQAAATAGTAARLLAQRQYDEAAAHYRQALQTLEQLYGSRDARLQAALAAAQQALADNDTGAAIKQFQRVLAIEPQQPAATLGIARAAVRTEVLEAMRQGDMAGNNGDLPAAQAAYQQAVTLDGKYRPAVAALAQVTASRQDVAFRDAMSRTLTALDAGQLNTAGKALHEAAQLQPQAAVVAAAQQRLAVARQQAQLQRLRGAAAKQVASENWQGAADLFAQALAVDSSAGFASEGLVQARERKKLNAQFDHYLDKPERIFSPQPLANARLLLTAASAAPANEPLLANKIARLQKLVTQAETPVAVSLGSDGETEVAIYHVGKLGRFINHRLELLPGNYTVVGSRAGYRDVRKQLMVTPGSSTIALQLACEEPI